MALRWLFVAPLVIVVTIGFSSIALTQIDALKEERLEEELLYLPNEKLLNHFTAGLSGVVADLLWVQTIQYTAREFHNVNRKFTWLEHMCTTVTRIDPYFEGAYVYGGMLLAAIGGDDEALNLLKRGLADNPYSWEIPFEISKVFVLNRYQEKNSPAIASHYLRMVADRSDRPDFYYRWIAGLQKQHDLGEDQRRIWEDIIAENKNEFLVELAKSKLLDITISKNVERLREAAEQFFDDLGRNPRTIEDLTTEGYIERVPQNPDHGRYYLDSNGFAQNSLLVENLRQERLRMLNAAMIQFKDAHGRFPKSLDEWAEAVKSPPPFHPEAGKEWRYDAVTGTVY